MSKETEVSRREFLKTGASFAALSGLGFIPSPEPAMAAGYSDPSPQTAEGPRGWVPQPYSIQRDDAAGTLTLSTRYYTVEHDLKKGGAISKISYTHGSSPNLLLRPVEAWVRLKKENPPARAGGRNARQEFFSDLNNPSPSVLVSKSGKAEVVTVESALINKAGAGLGCQNQDELFLSLGIHQDPQGIQAPGDPAGSSRHVCSFHVV